VFHGSSVIYFRFKSIILHLSAFDSEKNVVYYNKKNKTRRQKRWLFSFVATAVLPKKPGANPGNALNAVPQTHLPNGIPVKANKKQHLLLLCLERYL